MNSYVANNNSLTNPNFVLKLSMMTFLIVQAIRQLVLVNTQFGDGDKNETRAGQVAAWMTITLTLVVAALLYPSGPLSRKTTLGGLFLLFAAVMGSGVAMVYTTLDTSKTKNDKGTQINKEVSNKAEPSRRWFGIAHIVFAVLVFAFLLYSLTA
jgi:hypothetical protein